MFIYSICIQYLVGAHFALITAFQGNSVASRVLDARGRLCVMSLEAHVKSIQGVIGKNAHSKSLSLLACHICSLCIKVMTDNTK